MRVVIFFLFLTGSCHGFAQQQTLRTFAKEQAIQDSMQQLAVQKRAANTNTLQHFADTLGKRTFLLVANGDNTYSYRATLNQQAAITTGAFQLQDNANGFQLSGEGMSCGIWEDGLVKDHVEFGNRILSKEGNSDFNHATHVTGTILASGVNPLAKGMAPQAKAYTFDFGNDLSEMASLAREDDKGLLFSNHSYGAVTGWSKPNGTWTWYGDVDISAEEDYRHGFYSQRTKNIDALAYLSPYYTIVWAAGNDRFETGDGSHPADCNKGTGYDCIIPDAVGKNIITVGAVSKVLSYTSASSVSMSHYSSWGPTDDGRIKPDVVGAGTDVFSTIATGTNAYASFTGTSMATPTVTGSLMLLQELYAKLNAGHYMKASTLKALAIHTAKEAGPRPGPDYQFGWGLLDVKAAADVLMAANGKETIILESTLQNANTIEFDIQPTANKKITLTLCWTDPEGSPVAASLDPLDKMLVNDLDIRLIDEDGTITSPWILNPSVPQAQATKGDNTRDNVEKIEFETPLTKRYTVFIRHKGELKNAIQDFSLVLTYTDRASPSTIFYWVGGSGQWHDVNHWSFTSGGAPAGELPDKLDAIIIDEQALMEEDTIEVLQDATVSRITWLNSKASVLKLAGNTLRIANNLTVSSKNMRIAGGGNIHFVNSDKGVVNLSDNNFSTENFVFEGGVWQINGSFQIRNIRLEAGAHTWNSRSIHAQAIDLISPLSWNISSANILLATSLRLPTYNFIFNSRNATLTTEATVEIDWQNNVFEGRIIVPPASNVIMQRGGYLASLYVQGNLETTNSFVWDSVQIFENAKWNLGNNTNQVVQKYFQINSSSVESSELSSTTSAAVTLQQHKKMCFENVIVKNIALLGNSIINLSAASVIENSSNWLQVPCEEVLFADFTIDYSCEGALTKFTDTSLGNPDAWTWTFNELGAEESTSSEQHPSRVYAEAGLYNVSLTLQNNSQVTSYSKEISIQPNTLEPNQLVVNTSGQLMSLNTASTYQWYRDRIPVQEETNRTYSFMNQPGVYEVLLTQGVCNRLSAPYLVTDVETQQAGVAIFPNPSDIAFAIEVVPSLIETKAFIDDMHGRRISEFDIRFPIETSTLAEGVYVVQFTKTNGQSVSRRLIVKH